MIPPAGVGPVAFIDGTDPVKEGMVHPLSDAFPAGKPKLLDQRLQESVCRLVIAQRFNAGVSIIKEASPVGTEGPRSVREINRSIGRSFRP